MLLATSRSPQTRLTILLLLIGCWLVTSCVKRSFNEQSTITRLNPTMNDEALPNPRININTASAAQLETLPGIGKALAARIIEHREQFGPFRKPEHLIIVRGISDKRFRALQNLIAVE